MPAIVRVKRRIDEEPLSAFILNSRKRRRLAEGDDDAETIVGTSAIVDSGDVAGNNVFVRKSEEEDEISTILKFAGTIAKQDNVATTQLARLTKEEARELVQQKMRKPNSMTHTERARHEMRQSMHEQRFRVVNCLRTAAVDASASASMTTAAARTNIVDVQGNANAQTTNPITILDIERQQCKATTINNQPATPSAAATVATTPSLALEDKLNQPPCDSDAGFVYDLYISENQQATDDYVDFMDDNYLSVRAFDDLVYDERYNNESADDSDSSDDSNCENHFANDYPDEEDGDHDSDEQYEDLEEANDELRLNFGNFIIADNDEDDDDNEDELLDASSSDECDDEVLYEDPYVHFHLVDGADDDRFVDDIDACADRYGAAYARYKKRLMKNDLDDDADDDERYHSASENDDDADYYK